MRPDLNQLYEAVQATRPLLRNITAAVERGSLKQGITVGQRAILEGLMLNPGATAPLLSASLQLKRQYVARILQEVLQADLAESRPNPNRARSFCYWLTKRGKAVIATIRDDEMKKLSDFAAHHEAGELAAYHKVQLALTRYFAELAKET